MRLKDFFPLFLCALITVTVMPARSLNEQDNQGVIDDFMRTRGSDFAPRENPVKPRKSKPAVRPKSPAIPKEPVGSDTPQASDAASNANESLFRIGLGYTIFRYKSDNELVAIEPGKTFTAGDQLLVELETNADGYLYIFNAEDDSNPNMLYPNITLNRGRNDISAHTRDRFPADDQAEFVIDEKPATERLYIIFSRNPLQDVPTGEKLDKLCDRNRDDCDWRPTPALWEKIKSLASATKVVEGRNRELARVEISIRSDSLTRGIKVKPRAPIPAVIRMSDSPRADVLLTTIDLIHN